MLATFVNKPLSLSCLALVGLGTVYPHSLSESSLELVFQSITCRQQLKWLALSSSRLHCFFLPARMDAMPIDAFEDLQEPAARSVADWEEVQFESHSTECTGSETTFRYSVSAPMAPPGEWGSGISTQRNEGTDASMVNYFEGHHSYSASEVIWTRLPSKSPPGLESADNSGKD